MNKLISLSLKGYIVSFIALCAVTFGAQVHAMNCSNIPAWSSSTEYKTAGFQVQTANQAYTNKWWTLNENPTVSGQWGVWTLNGTCDGVVASSKAASSVPASSVPSSVKSSTAVQSSIVTISSSSVGGNCNSVQYVAGTTYNAGQLVQNAGNEYRCDIAGWCSSTAAWAYAPGTGSAWGSAWTLVRSCSGGASSTPSSVGSSVKSSSPSSVASSVSSIVNNKLPKHALVGYWHNFDNGSGLIRMANVDSAWDVIVVAFADDAGNGSVAFNLDAALNKAQFIADVAAKRASGKTVVLSFGGQNGTVTLNNSTNVTNFVNSTTAIMNEYGFDGIDIDLESGAGVSWGAAVVTNLPIAVKQLKARFPNLYLSMAPEHPYVQGGFVAASSIWGAYLPMIDSLRNELSILHVQLYNNGGLSTPYSGQTLAAGSVDFMVASIKMLIEGFPMANNTTFQGLRPDQVALGLPSGPSSATSGQASMNDINSAVNCLAKLVSCGSIRPNQAYPTFRGVMTWSINWDAHDGRNFSVPVGNNLKALP